MIQTDRLCNCNQIKWGRSSARDVFGKTSHALNSKQEHTARPRLLGILATYGLIYVDSSLFQ